MKSTMQDYQLTIASLMHHGTGVHPDSEVVTATADGSRSITYAELGKRTARLAGALRSLGIEGDDRVGTFQWNNAEHLEAYLAIPSMGAVLHTLNIRLFPEQLIYVANHAEDKVVIVDDSLVGLLAPQLPHFETVTHVLVAGPDAAAANLDSLRSSGKEILLYEDVLAEQPDVPDGRVPPVASVDRGPGEVGQVVAGVGERRREVVDGEAHALDGTAVERALGAICGQPAERF